MAYEITIKWDFMTADVMNKQLSQCYNCNGKIGYLRCSISMEREQELLRLIFGESPKELMPYDFVNNYLRLPDLLNAYYTGERLPECQDIKDYMQLMRINNSNLSQADKLEFCQHIIDFFKLGIRMQVGNTNPCIKIDY